MSKRFRLIVLLTVSVLIGVITVSLVSLDRARSTAQVQRLPDGSRLRLEAVTYGKEHRVVLGTWWQKVLHRFLPAPLKNQYPPPKWLDYPRLTHFTDRPDALVLWTSLTSGKGPRLGPRGNVRVVAFDEHGCEAETGSRVYRGAYHPGNAEPWKLPAYPRRGRTVGMRVYERDAVGRWAPVAQFFTSNPHPGPHPVWTPQPLPLAKQRDGLTFTLAALRTDVPGAELGITAPEDEWTVAAFRVTRSSLPAPEWEPVDLLLSDATGNVWKPRICYHDRHGDRTRLFFRGRLWPDERAWKLRVEFARIPDPGPGASWTIRGAAAPTPGAVANSQHRIRAGGVTIRLLSISGEGAFSWLGNTSTDSANAHMRFSPPPLGWRMRLLKAVDDQGRNCLTSRPQSGFIGVYSFRLNIPPGAKLLDLTITPHQKSHWIEFMAAPSPPRKSTLQKAFPPATEAS